MENFGLSGEAESEAPPDEQQPDEAEETSNASPPKKKNEKPLDLSKLDQKSVKMMVMLMLYLLEQNMSTAEFFQEVIYQQNVKSKTKQQTLEIMNSEDFFKIMCEKGIRKKDTEHQNLKEFLQLSPNFPNLIVVKNIKKTLEQMADNEAFMEAIREDVMAGEEMAQDDAERMAKEQAIE